VRNLACEGEYWQLASLKDVIQNYQKGRELPVKKGVVYVFHLIRTVQSLLARLRPGAQTGRNNRSAAAQPGCIRGTIRNSDPYQRVNGT
jgi:hypothetical protein